MILPPSTCPVEISRCFRPGLLDPLLGSLLIGPLGCWGLLRNSYLLCLSLPIFRCVCVCVFLVTQSCGDRVLIGWTELCVEVVPEPGKRRGSETTGLGQAHCGQSQLTNGFTLKSFDGVCLWRDPCSDCRDVWCLLPPGLSLLVSPLSWSLLSPPSWSLLSPGLSSLLVSPLSWSLLPPGLSCLMEVPPP